MKRWIVIPALLLALLLTACGAEEAGTGRNSFWETMGIDAEEIVLEVDGREVPAWRYVWWLGRGCAAMAEACAVSGTVPDWDQSLEEGTLADYVRQRALEDTVLCAVVENWAEREQVLLTVSPQDDLAAPFPAEARQLQEMDRVGLLYGALCRMAGEESSPLVTEEALLAFGQETGLAAVERQELASLWVEAALLDVAEAAAVQEREGLQKLTPAAWERASKVE